MELILPEKDEYGREKDLSYCNACMVCKAVGWCVQNRDYDALLMKMAEADRIVFAPLTSDDPNIRRLLQPEETWFPERRVEFIRSAYEKVHGTVVVRDQTLLADIKKLFINAKIEWEN